MMNSGDKGLFLVTRGSEEGIGGTIGQYSKECCGFAVVVRRGGIFLIYCLNFWSTSL